MKFIKSVLKTTFLSIVYIAIISAIYFGINSLLKAPFNPIEYAIMLSISSIILHFSCKERTRND